MNRLFHFMLTALLCAPGAQAAKDALSFPAGRYRDGDVLSVQEHDVVLREQGWVSYALRFEWPEDYQFVILARRDGASKQVPSLKVSVDDEEVRLQPVISEAWATYSFRCPVNKGERRVKLSSPVSGADDIHLASVVVVAPRKAAGVTLLESSRSADPLKDANLLFHEKLIARIRETRTGQLRVQVLDKAGEPVKGVSVRVSQQRHSFLFGASQLTAAYDGTLSMRLRNEYKEQFLRRFNCVGTGEALTWRYMEPQPGRYYYTVGDKMIDWARARGLAVWGEDVYSECAEELPAWASAVSDARMRSVAGLRARVMANRYRGRVDALAVNGNMISCGHPGERFGAGMRKQLFHEIRASDPSAKLFLNEDIDLDTGRPETFMQPLRALLESGIPADGIGIRARFDGQPNAFRVERSLDALAQLGLPVRITGYACDDPDEQARLRAMESFFRVAFSHPAVEGISVRDFWFSESAGFPLLNADFSPSPLGHLYERLVFSEWWTETEGLTDKNGIFETRAFLGEYEVGVALSPTREIKQKAVVTSGDNPPVVFSY